MKVKVKRKTKLMIIKKVFNKNFCFFIISGKQKLLSEFFGKNSVLHISFFKYLINVDFLVRYAFSYVCIFKFKDFIKLFELVYDKRIVVHQICINNNFINFYGLIDFDQYIYTKKILILNIFLSNIYFLVFIILKFLLDLIETLYFLLQKQC